MTVDEYDSALKDIQKGDKFIYEPIGTFNIFTGVDFLRFNIDEEVWSQGQVHTFLNQPIFIMPQYSSLTKLTSQENRDNSNFIVSGGVNPYTNQLQTAVFGVEFNEEMERINLSFEHEEFNLDLGRMMHQSFIVNGPSGKRLILIGGKVGSSASKCVFTNTVVGFDLKYVLQPGLRERVKTDAKFRAKFDPAFNDRLEWINLASMNSARANFGASVFKNQVFVYGGISS